MKINERVTLGKDSPQHWRRRNQDFVTHDENFII
jgi:hypothetical protein